MKKNNTKDYMYATLTLLAQKKNKTGVCPAPEDLAAFSEGKLKGKKRKKIIEHMNDCTECRRQWLFVESAIEETQVREVSLVQKFLNKIKNMKPKMALTTGGIGFALAACLLIIIFYPGHDDISKMIVSSYNQLPADSIARYSSFVSRGEDNYTDEEYQSSNHFFAYKTGLSTGKAKLLGKSVPLTEIEMKDDLNAVFYSLGTWVVALKCACFSTSKLSDQFWSEQLTISNSLKDKLLKETKTKEIEPITLETITIFENAITQIKMSEGKSDGCEEISLAIEALENSLR